MTELISAVTGAIVAALATWLFTRKRLTYIQCNLAHRSFFHVGLPGVHFLVRDEAIKHFGVAQFRFHNTGSKVISQPRFALCLSDYVKIMSASSRVLPDEQDEPAITQRGEESKGSRCKSGRSSLEVDGSTIRISVDTLFPHELKGEEIILDVFTNMPIEPDRDVRVTGQGTLSDGTGWAAQFSGVAASDRLWKNPIFLANRVVMIGLLVSLVVYLAARRPWDIFKADPALLATALRDPFLWSWLGAFVLFTMWMFVLGMRGRAFTLPMPFLRRHLMVRFGRR
jgi:hypothetical protein